MKKIPQKNWMMSKYGKEVVPWECRLTIPNIHGNNCGEFNNG
jgi:hypothetical protein